MTTREMTEAAALSLAIFALNTLADPEASSPEDLSALDAQTESALTVLAEMRDRLPATAIAPVTLALRLDQVVPGDHLLALGETAYRPARVAKTRLEPIDGGPGGVEFERRPGETARFVLYPAAVGRQRLLVRRG